jgi:hypothetical protein
MGRSDGRPFPPYRVVFSHSTKHLIKARVGIDATRSQAPMGSRGWSDMMNAAMEDFTRWCERKLAKSADQLEAIEGGQFNVVPRTSR